MPSTLPTSPRAVNASTARPTHADVRSARERSPSPTKQDVDLGDPINLADGRWGFVTREFYDDLRAHRLPPAALFVWFELVALGLLRSGSCYRLVEELSVATDRKESAVKSAIKALVAYGWLEIKTIKGKDRHDDRNKTRRRFYPGRRALESLENWQRERDRWSIARGQETDPSSVVRGQKTDPCLASRVQETDPSRGQKTAGSPPVPPSPVRSKKESTHNSRVGACASEDLEPFQAPCGPAIIVPEVSEIPIVGPSIEELAKLALKLFKDEDFAAEILRARTLLTSILRGRHDCYAAALREAAMKPDIGSLCPSVLAIARRHVERGGSPPRGGEGRGFEGGRAPSPPHRPGQYSTPGSDALPPGKAERNTNSRRRPRPRPGRHVNEGRAHVD